MSNRYTFDQDRLRYNELNNNIRTKVVKIFSYIFSSFFVGILLIVIYSFFFDTPRERQLRQENESLLKDYQVLHQRYSRIDTIINELSTMDKNIYMTIFETEPMPESRSKFHFENYHELFNKSNNDLVWDTYEQLENIYDRMNEFSPEFQSLNRMAARKEELLSSIPGIQPVYNKDLTRMASGFGNKMHPYYNIKKFHSGMDFTAPTGTDVYATGAGVIEEIRNTNRGHGKTIVIDHGFGYKTVYSHLDKFNVRRNQEVLRGDIIGWVGNTGFSVAPHLHYEVHFNGKPVNPVNFYFLDLSPAEYDKMIELSVKSGQSFD